MIKINGWWINQVWTGVRFRLAVIMGFDTWMECTVEEEICANDNKYVR